MTTRQDRLALALAALLGTTATIHFVAPDVFSVAVPRYLPGSDRFWILLSGVAEATCAITIAIPRTRRVGGLLALLLFIAVFPGNLQMAYDAENTSRKIATWLRLPIQIPLIWWAWKVFRPSLKTNPL